MQHHSFSRNVPPLSFCWLRLPKRIFLVPRQSNRPVNNRIITSLVHELPPWSVDDTKKSENHFVVILLTGKTKATTVEKKVDMKDAPLVGKLGSTEKSKSLKDWIKWNLIYKGYFLKSPVRVFHQVCGVTGRTGFWPRRFWILRYRDEVEVYKTKTKRASIYTITCYPVLKSFTVLRHLDDRAKDLRTTTSPTRALSDEHNNNSGFITAVKITALFRLKLKSPLNT